MIRPSSKLRSALILAATVALTACPQHGAADFATADKLPDDERRPDGIAVDLSSEPPPWRDSAETDVPIVTLRTPLGAEAALSTIRSFFDAMVREEISAMSKLVQAGALLEDTRRRRARPQPSTPTRASGLQNITSSWRERFRKREYERLAARLVYRESDIVTYRRDQLDALPIAVRYSGAARSDVEATDLVLRVPITTHTVRNERLLGNEMFFWLRRTEDRYVIYRMAEDLPF